MLQFQENMYDVADTPDKQVNNWETMARMECLAFNQVLCEPYMDVLAAMLVFLQGYPEVDNGYSVTEKADGSKTYSLKHDMNYIVMAIRNQSGIDLSYMRTEPFHWWLFLLEFKTLSGDHRILQLMGWRAYEGKDPEMLRLQKMVALPEEYTKSERAIFDESDNIFYNT